MAITVRHGVNTNTLDGLGGSSVGQIRERTRELLNLAPHEEARVNGIPATDETVVSDGQTLEFVKVAGEKGLRPAA